MKQFSLRLAVINVSPVLVPLELLLSTHFPTSEGWTAELTIGLWFVVPTTGFEPTRVDLTRFETLWLNHSAKFGGITRFSVRAMLRIGGSFMMNIKVSQSGIGSGSLGCGG